MIKASAIFSAHVIHVLLRNTLISLVVIFIALFFWLKSGIEIDSLYIDKYKVEKLYLKLDKKFTFKAKNIVIPQNKSKPSLESIDKTFDKIKYLFTFFDEIDFENVYFDDNKIHFVFVDNILYITSDEYEIAGNIHRIEQRLVAKVSMLTLKKLDISLKGSLEYNLKNHQLATKGNFNAFGIEGDFIAHKKKETIGFKMKSKTFNNLKPLVEALSIKNEKIKSWIVEKIQAEKYTINLVEGEGSIREDRFKLNFETLKASLYVENPKIYYHQDLAPVIANSFTLKYSDYALNAVLDKPRYLDRKLDESKVIIDGFRDMNILLKLDLHIQTLFDEEVKKILSVYNVHIPLKQKGEPVITNIKLAIPLNKKNKNKKISIDILANIQQSDIDYKGVTLPIKEATLKYNNKKKEPLTIKAMLQKGTVTLGKKSLPVLGGDITYGKNIGHLDKVWIKESWYEGAFTGDIDFTKKEAKLKAKIKWLNIGKNEKIIVVKDKTLPLYITYKNEVKLDFPSIGIKVKSNKDVLRINVKDIQKIKRYLKNVPIALDGGNIDIIEKSGNYSFEGTLKRDACFFYSKNALCQTTIPFRGKLKNENFTFYAFGKRFEYNSKKSRVKLNKLHIDIKKFLEEKSGQKSKKAKDKKLLILGKNSKIRYKTHTLVTNTYTIEVSKKGDVKATGSLDGKIVNFSKKGEILTFNALRIKDDMLHPLIGFDGIQDGRYTLSLSGNPDKIMKGKIIIKGGVIKNFKAYNNTIALINALPALATFSNPGFSGKGFLVQEGTIEYHIKKDNIVFDSIYIKGKSATIIGKGRININKKTIDIDLAIHTARELGKVVGNLPLLGYILLGKDKSITMGLTIEGTLENPKVKTSAGKDILTLPFKLIKRIFESPAHIINK